MDTGIKVGDVMTRNFVSVSPRTGIALCSKVMAKKRVGSLVVKEGSKLRGVITEGDIIRAIAKKGSLKIPAEKVMSRRITTVDPSKDISHAFKIMKRKKLRWLPVVFKGRIVGFLTKKDINRIRPALVDIISQSVKVAEEREKKRRVKTVDKQRYTREGPCQECGVYDILFKTNGKFLCERCKRKG
ncbi:MAG: CBS domain-containing protein [archaeon]|nr:MAG: CBS domain-containing protein [archaeon]